MSYHIYLKDTIRWGGINVTFIHMVLTLRNNATFIKLQTTRVIFEFMREEQKENLLLCCSTQQIVPGASSIPFRFLAIQSNTNFYSNP